MKTKTKPEVFLDLLLLTMTLILFLSAIMPMLFNYSLIEKFACLIFYGAFGYVMGDRWLGNI